MSEPTRRRRRRADVRRERRSLGIRALRVVVWTASSALLLGCGATWFAYHTLISGLTTSDALDAVRKKAPPHLDDAVNLLLIGLDSRKDMNGNDLPRQFVQKELHAGSSSIGYYNTNTLILMHIPAGGGKVQAFSIPRDDYVQTLNGDGSAQGHYKIKEAYANAYAAAHDKYAQQGVKGAQLEARSREAGREATLATVQDFTGVPIDHFAEVNLLGFYDIAHVLQPITVCLNHAVQDRYSGADFPAGVQQLNARQALAFVRQRHGLDAGDLDRTRRQQAFISSVTHQLKTQGVWASPSKLQGLFDTVKKDIVLDSSWNVLDFAQQATNLTGGNVVFHTLPIEGFALRNSQDVNLVDPEKIKAMVRQEFSDTPSPTATAADTAPAAPAVVDVHNGNGAEGDASTALSYLVELGYTAGVTDNAAVQPATTVVYGPGAQKAAQQIAHRFNAAAPASSSAVPAGHVVVTLGESFTLPDPKASSPAVTESHASSPADSGPAVKAGGVPCVN
ncbi:LCP family protein [Streptomyces nodosus]|uniref:LCP family protein n=1 Tax=Streptomyces nodosus TaxID=40318 RepID=UPI0037F82127